LDIDAYLAWKRTSLLIWGHFTSRLAMFLIADKKASTHKALISASRVCFRGFDKLIIIYPITQLLTILGLLSFCVLFVWIIPLRQMIEAYIYESIYTKTCVKKDEEEKDKSSIIMPAYLKG